MFVFDGIVSFAITVSRPPSKTKHMFVEQTFMKHGAGRATMPHCSKSLLLYCHSRQNQNGKRTPVTSTLGVVKQAL